MVIEFERCLYSLCKSTFKQQCPFMGGAGILTPSLMPLLSFISFKAIITKYIVAIILKLDLLDQLRVRKIKYFLLRPFIPSLTPLRQIYCANALSFCLSWKDFITLSLLKNNSVDTKF